MTIPARPKLIRRVALWFAQLLRRWAFWLDMRTAEPVNIYDFASEEPLTEEEWRDFREAIGLDPEE